MNLVITRDRFHFLLYALCVIIPFFNNYELTFSVWALTAITTIKRRYSVSFLIYTSFFLFLFLFALWVGAFRDYSSYFIIRDITYLLKPIIGLFIGYQLFRKQTPEPFLYIVYAGVIIALYHIVLVVLALIMHSIPNIHVLRYYGGYFNDFEVYVLIILIFSEKFNLQLDKKKRKIFLCILAISSFLYLARTNFIQFIVLYMALKGYFLLNKRNLYILGSIIIFIGLSYTILFYYNPVRNGGGLDAFLYKVKNSPAEAFKTKVSRENWKDFHDNYRAYENIRTIEQVSTNNTILFGEGMGSRVDLKQEVYLGDMYLRHISILHNGFMTVLIKTGLFGIFVYLMSIVFFFKNPKSKDTRVKAINLLFIGTGIFLIISNWVFLGFYNLLDTKILIVGFLFAYREYLIKKEVVV